MISRRCASASIVPTAASGIAPSRPVKGLTILAGREQAVAVLVERNPRLDVDLGGLRHAAAVPNAACAVLRWNERECAATLPRKRWASATSFHPVERGVRPFEERLRILLPFKLNNPA
jgi:hypothetical protein